MTTRMIPSSGLSNNQMTIPRMTSINPIYFFFFFLPPLFHLRAFRANVARLRVLGFFDFFMARSLLTGIFLPFFALADLRSLPRLDFLILMPLLRAMRGAYHSAFRWPTQMPCAALLHLARLDVGCHRSCR
jgi:hypothetical protein